MANHGSNLNDNVSIHALKCFCTVAEIENITKAAELLYISQPALSRKLSQLEAQVGVPLFKRKKNGVELTADGRVVYEHCRNIIENCESLFSGCQHTEENLSGSLKFGFQRPSIEFALKLSREFNSAYPSVSINMEKIGKYNVIEELLNSFDAALLFTRELKNYANLIDSIPVGSCKMAVMVPKTHPLATRDVIDLAELAGLDYVFYHLHIRVKARLKADTSAVILALFSIFFLFCKSSSHLFQKW